MSDTDYVVIDGYPNENNTINHNEVIINFDGVFFVSNDDKQSKKSFNDPISIDDYDLSDKPLDYDKQKSNIESTSTDLNINLLAPPVTVCTHQPLIEESPPPDPEFAEKSMDEIIRLECESINPALPNLSTNCEKTSFFLVQQLKQLELIKRSTTLKKIDKHYLYEKQLQLMTEIDDIDDINPSSLYFKCENNLFTNILDIVMNDLIAFFA